MTEFQAPKPFDGERYDAYAQRLFDASADHARGLFALASERPEPKEWR